VEQPDGTIKRITEVNQIEEYLIHHRQPKNFGQSEGTPLTQEPYRGWLSIDTNTPWADTLVNTHVFPASIPAIDKFWEEIANLNTTPWSSLILKIPLEEKERMRRDALMGWIQLVAKCLSLPIQSRFLGCHMASTPYVQDDGETNDLDSTDG
jgi:hypothetical protein